MSEESAAKLRGGYYTPQPVAEWLARWAIRTPQDRVLEPSCGDGAFLLAAIQQLSRLRGGSGARRNQVIGIEFIPKEALKALARAPGSSVVVSDFFEWLDDVQPAAFDVVLGNPPFIRYQNFPEASRARAMRFMEERGLRPNRLTNVWVPFVVAATHLLKPGGRLAMVIPAELLQVTYAAQLRQYLVDSFAKLTIFACNEMFFTDAEQEVVLLAAEGKLAQPEANNRCDIALLASNSVGELIQAPADTKRHEEAKFVQHDSEKWLKYFLDAREISLMRALRENPAIGSLSDHATIDVGIVTGKNDFFVLSQAAVREFQLDRFVVPLVGRSAQLLGTVLRQREYAQLVEKGNKVFLLHLASHEASSFTPGLRKLIAEGEKNGYHEGYKCSIRDPWYRVPSVWQPDCFLFRQIYDFPRVVVNRAGATSTDTIHRMQCRGPAARVAANVYTHLTAASAEIEGRSYGGGVLELEPTEAERLLFPKHINGALPIEEADSLVRAGRLAEVLEHNDRVVLQESLGLTKGDCSSLRGIWEKMRGRRQSRRRTRS